MATDPDSSRFERAKQRFQEGLAHFESGHFQEAERCFSESLSVLPGRVSTLVNLAATQLQLASPVAALASAEQALAAEPDDADAWLHRGTALAELGRPGDALQSFDRLLALSPGHAQAWSRRGGVLREMNRLDEAALAFEQALAHGGDTELNSYYLAAVRAGQAPATAPRRYVQSLFDAYAGEFDAHLVGTLHYRAHEVLTRHLHDLHGPGGGRFVSALDLGCGTGLCGPQVRPRVASLTGVDLSGPMLEKARALGVYDHLAQADIVEHLRSTEARHDLVLAADVFIYVGDLEPVFAALPRVMPAGGVFCFSAELCAERAAHEKAASGVAPGGSAGFELMPSLRYAHSEHYLQDLAARHGFDITRLVREPVREEQRETIDGLFVYLVRR